MLDLGDGEAVAFKVESHNHPSAVEPFQGAATGVGGILRDVVAMGARPVALLDGLLRRALTTTSSGRSGIGGYGTRSASQPWAARPPSTRPTRTTARERDVRRPPPAERLTRASTARPGDLVLLFGATTGRDGIGGASVLASQELGEDDPDKRPSQIGDPFTGNKLIEASLELVERGLVASLQDCGAAGLASALSKWRATGSASTSGSTACRCEKLEPWEIVVSESQERMVAAPPATRLAAAEEVCARWESPTP